MRFVIDNRLKVIAKQQPAYANALICAMAVAWGMVQPAAAQVAPVISDYPTLQAAIYQGGGPGGVINQFSTNYLQITLATASETFNIATNITIDGTTNQILLDGNHLARLFNVKRGTTLTLANLQILGGISALGGAISNQGTLIVSNCFFYSNTASNANGINGLDATTNGTDSGTGGTSGGGASGGAIYSTGTLIVSFTTFSNNVVTGGTGGAGGAGAATDFIFGGNGGAGGGGGSAYGGAIYAGGTNVFFCAQFIMNQCVAGSGGAGGANGPGRIPGTSGSGGAGGAAAGGAILVSGALYMTNCLFYTNTVLAGSSAAAALLSDGISDNGINGGAAVGGGTDISSATTTAYIENTTFFNNFCQGGAGGNTLDDPPTSTAGNGGSAFGGGLSSAAALTQLRCCTLATNVIIGGANGVTTTGANNGSAGTVGGFDIVRTAGTLKVSGTILSGGTNAAPNYTPNAAGAITDEGYNLSSDASPAFTSSTSRSLLDPVLDSGLAPNGGPNIGPTNLIVPTLTLAILPGPPVSLAPSPAIGALRGIAGVSFPAFDETLAARGNVADIGAYELTPPGTDLIPRTIISQPAGQAVTVGGKAVFTVEAQGDNLGYQWFQNGTNLLGGANSNSLTISKVTLANAGSYTVVVDNSLGAVTSQIAVLTILAPSVPPTVSILSPPANARVTDSVAGGTASDKIGIEAVNYWITNLNGGVTVSSGQAILSPGSGSASNWTVTDFPPGTNVLAVQSTASNVNSALATRAFFYEVPVPFTLTANGGGSGTVTGAPSVHGGSAPTNNAPLFVGEGYSLTAAPDKTSLFAGWTVSTGGSVTTGSNAVLRFIMQSNLTVQATFIPNFFLELTGTYNGLFYDSNAITEETAGMLSGLTLGKQGAFSGKVLLGGKSYAMAGTFDAQGNASATVPRSSLLGGPVAITMTLGASPPQIFGQVSTSLGTASLIADLATRVAGTAQYTMLLEPSAASTADSPPGDGYALITDSAGTITLSGALADGTAFSQSVAASQTGNVPVYANLYGATGLLLGWINISNLDAGSLESMALAWIKKPSKSTARYTEGFTNLLSNIGSPWIPAAPALVLTNGQLIVSNVDLSLDYSVAVANNNTLSDLSAEPANSLSGSINSKNGLLSVKFGNGSGRATTAGAGAVLQNQAVGGGFFLTPTNAGAILIEDGPP